MHTGVELLSVAEVILRGYGGIMEKVNVPGQKEVNGVQHLGFGIIVVKYQCCPEEFLNILWDAVVPPFSVERDGDCRDFSLSRCLLIKSSPLNYVPCCRCGGF